MVVQLLCFRIVADKYSVINHLMVSSLNDFNLADSDHDSDTVNRDYYVLENFKLQYTYIA